MSSAELMPPLIPGDHIAITEAARSVEAERQARLAIVGGEMLLQMYAQTEELFEHFKPKLDLSYVRFGEPYFVRASLPRIAINRSSSGAGSRRSVNMHTTSLFYEVETNPQDDDTLAYLGASQHISRQDRIKLLDTAGVPDDISKVTRLGARVMTMSNDPSQQVGRMLRETSTAVTVMGSQWSIPAAELTEFVEGYEPSRKQNRRERRQFNSSFRRSFIPKHLRDLAQAVDDTYLAVFHR